MPPVSSTVLRHCAAIEAPRQRRLERPPAACPRSCIREVGQRNGGTCPAALAVMIIAPSRLVHVHGGASGAQAAVRVVRAVAAIDWEALRIEKYRKYYDAGVAFALQRGKSP